MTELFAASRQWASRPDDERFISLLDMHEHFQHVRANSRELTVSSRRLEARPMEDHSGLEILGPQGSGVAPTHWSFGQLSQLAEAPASYLRSLPSPIVADCINFGLRFKRGIEDVGVLLYRNSGPAELRAATGPRYGRIWNEDILSSLCRRFGDGVSDSDWRVPGEFGKAVAVTKANTTLYAGDRDMFVFLADERNRITIPNRRHGEAGSLARGFFLWNSEVGSTSFGLGMFLFDYACCNRIVWGAQNYSEIRLRHTASAPDRWLEEVQPVLSSYANASARPLELALLEAQNDKLGTKLDDFLGQRFGKRMVETLKAVHFTEEARPIESRWDVATAVTAYARSLPHQDSRVALERQAGELILPKRLAPSLADLDLD